MNHTMKHSIAAGILLILILMATGIVLAEEGEPPLTIDQLNSAAQVSEIPRPARNF